LNIVYDSGIEWKDQTLVLKPSETEEGVFHVTVTLDAESEPSIWGRIRGFAKWKGEIRNGAMICKIEGISSHGEYAGEGVHHGTAKGTFSRRRASGTIRMQSEGNLRKAKWTAERIS